MAGTAGKNEVVAKVTGAGRATMSAGKTAMAREIAEIPEVAARQLAEGLDRYREVGERLRRLAPRFLVTCARGSSDHAATYLKYLVETRIGIPVASMGPSVASVYAAPLALEGGVCVTISQSGRSPDLACFQERARGSGADTIALTNTPDSPVGSGASELVPMLAGPETAVAATKSFVAALVAVAGIVAGWTRDGALAEGLDALPESLGEALACSWEGALSGIGGTASIYVIGRGPGLAAAAEAALKLKETCRLHAEAHSAAEVRHGPIALARGHPRDRFAALVFHVRDRSRRSLEIACEVLRASGAPVYATDFDATIPARLPVVPAGHPLLDPLSQVTSFYRFVETLSVALGEDPDRPAHLEKVTRTM